MWGGAGFSIQPDAHKDSIPVRSNPRGHGEGRVVLKRQADRVQASAVTSRTEAIGT